jgi:hypothetical protein
VCAGLFVGWAACCLLRARLSTGWMGYSYGTGLNVVGLAEQWACLTGGLWLV